MRILGIDPGERRVGLAVSDPLLLTAQGLDTFDRKKDGDLVDHIAGLVRDMDIQEIVVGNPLRASGEEGQGSAEARSLADTLRARLDVTVRLWDERFSSQEAQRVLRGTRAGKEAVDRIAAILILQSYLDHVRS
jgi:putative Holliday junction resolvase